MDYLGFFKYINGGKRREVIPQSIYKEIENKLNDSNVPLQWYTDVVSWVKQEFGYRKYHTLRAFMIRNFVSKLKVPRKSHYKKDEVAFETLKKNFLNQLQQIAKENNI